MAKIANKLHFLPLLNIKYIDVRGKFKCLISCKA
jgi:hypothetical protein